MEVGDELQASAAFSPGKTRYPEGPRASLDGCGKSRPHRDSIPVGVHPVASRCTDWVILANRNTRYHWYEQGAEKLTPRHNKYFSVAVTMWKSSGI